MGAAVIEARVIGQKLSVGASSFLSGSTVSVHFGPRFLSSPVPEGDCFLSALFLQASASTTPSVIGALNDFVSATITDSVAELTFPSLAPADPTFNQYAQVLMRLALVSPTGALLAASLPIPLSILSFSANSLVPGSEDTPVYLTIGGVRYKIVGGLRGTSPVLGLENLVTGTQTLCLSVPVTPIPAFDPNTATVADETNQVEALSAALGEMTGAV